jgi:hypothetical protein
MAIEVTPSKEYLRRFSSPLWDLLDLESCKPIQIVEGERGAYGFVIIEMEHFAYGLLSDNQDRASSTFFIVTIPESCSNRSINWYPPAYQVSVDRDYVYLVSPSKKLRPGDWERHLQLTIDVVESLDDPAAKAFSPSNKRTFQPVGGGVATYAISGLFSLGISVLGLVVGLGGIFGLIKVHSTWVESATKGLQYLFVSAVFFLGFLHCKKKIKKRM